MIYLLKVKECRMIDSELFDFIQTMFETKWKSVSVHGAVKNWNAALHSREKVQLLVIHIHCWVKPWEALNSRSLYLYMHIPLRTNYTTTKYVLFWNEKWKLTNLPPMFLNSSAKGYFFSHFCAHRISENYFTQISLDSTNSSSCWKGSYVHHEHFILGQLLYLAGGGGGEAEKILK